MTFAFPKPVKREKARKPLRRSRPMRKRAPRRLSRPGSHPEYLAWVREQPCWFTGALFSACEGRIHAHHAGRKPGVGMKADDLTAIPLCAKHHRAWHDMTPPFSGMNKLERFAWSERIIAHYQELYAGAEIARRRRAEALRGF